MMRPRHILLSITLLSTITASASQSTAFMRLDSLIANQNSNIKRMEQTIAVAKKKLNGNIGPEKEFDINNELYRAYAEFQNDSAQKFMRRNIEIAQQLNDNERLNEAKLNLMHMLTKAYLLDEVDEMVAQLDTNMLSPSQIIDYYKILSDIYLFKLEFHKGSVYEEQYQQQLTLLRSRITALAPEGSERQLLYHANYLNDTGKTDEAIKLLEKMLANYHSGDRTFSVITSSLAFYYSLQGNREKQKDLLAMSAASDIEGCIMENSALRQLAELLFDEGDIDRAYRYINCSVSDATYYGTRLRNVQASQLVPRIINAYQAKQEKNYRNMRNLIITLSVLAALLVAGVLALALLYKRYRRLSENRKVINEELKSTNQQLQERDKIKEQYLGRFLTFSSLLIDKNEEQRKAMNRLAMEDRLRELKAQLKSPHFDYENAKLFYQNFDSAFLNIYPNFIEEVNSLLLPEGHIETKEDEQLTRELRILALIRLGITDNKEIASILRASIATVYTYRSRLKARAINKDAFEDDIKRIQSSH